MTKAQRLLQIMLFMSYKKQFTAQEIADEFHISTRTVHRYILDLSELGMPIYAEQGRYGGYTVLSQKLLPPLWFTETETVAIFFAFQSLAYYQDLPFDTEITSVSQKLYHTLPKTAQAQINQLQDYIAFWNPKRTIKSPLLQDVVKHVLNQQTIKIHYASLSGNGVKHLHPIGVYAHDGLWYLPAYDMDKDKVLLYRLDRIREITEVLPAQQACMTLTEWFASQPIKKPTSLHVQLTPRGVRECLSTPYLEAIVMVNEDGSGYIDTIVDEDDIHFTIPLFFRLGANAHILAPPLLIELLCQQATHILQQYEKR